MLKAEWPLVSGVLLALAVVISMLHLGSPLGAYLSILNAGSSWLSREILATILFGGLWLAAFVLELRNVGGLWLGRLAALAGVVLVFVMSKLYTATVIPAWSTAYTTAAFLATALLLGGLLLLAVKPVAAAVPVGPALVLTGVGAQLIGLPMYLAGLSGGARAAAQSLAILMGTWQPALWISLLLLAAAAVAAGVIWQKQKVASVLVYGALAAGVGGAALLRVIFYAMGVPIQVG